MSTPKYVTLAGTVTTADDPQRGVWYGTGSCGYWTDDWSKLAKAGPGIPVCPECGTPGMQTTFKDWADGVMEYTKTHPGYGFFITFNQDCCHAKAGGFRAAWEKWLHENAAKAVQLIPDPEAK